MTRSESASPAPASDEALLVAERLSALLERRRAESGSSAAVRGTVIGARHSGRLLGNLLLTRAYLVDSELEYVLRRQAETGGALGEILLDLGLITERDLLDLLAEQLRMEVVDPARLDVDRATLALLPADEARRHAALPGVASTGTSTW